MNKLWAPAKTLIPIKMDFCSDTKKYHNMSLVTGTIVYVCDLRLSNKPGFQTFDWLIVNHRNKGYYIGRLATNFDVCNGLKSIRIQDKIQYCDDETIRELNNGVVKMFRSGVRVEGRELKKIDEKKYSVILDYILKA